MKEETLSYSQESIIESLKTLNLLVVSLNSMAMASVDDPSLDLAEEILSFLKAHQMLERLSDIREVLSEPFEGKDYSDEISLLEHLMKDIAYWEKTNKNS